MFVGFYGHAESFVRTIWMRAREGESVGIALFPDEKILWTLIYLHIYAITAISPMKFVF